TFCTQVSEEDLLDQPGMQPLRRRLLELARRYYQKFQREQGADPSPTLMRTLALSFMRSGIITSELGDGAEASRAFLRPKDILEELCRAEPKDVTLQVQLARCHIEIEVANRLYESGVSGVSAPLTHPSVNLMKPLVAGDPENLQYVRLLGRSYDMYGIREF